MTSPVYKLLYCSRNTIGGTADQQAGEIRQILASARANNSRRGITGALLFSGQCFAQVLEGPLDAVEATFERIQRDSRHGDVSLLEAGFVPQRDFPEWSMAFAGAPDVGALGEGSSGFANFSYDQAVETPTAAAAEVRDLLKQLVVQEDDWALA